MAAVKQGVTSLGIKATNGVVIATERKANSTLILTETLEKVCKITPDIGAVYSGMGPDFRVLINKSRKAAYGSYRKMYGSYPPTKILVSQIAKIMQEATQSGGVRPFGVSLLVAGYDDHNGFGLYQVDPSGAYFPWKATAIGKGATAAKTFLEKRWNDELELEDALHIALLTLKESVEGEFSGETIEIAIIGEENDDLLGYKGDPNARGPRFKKLTAQDIDDRLDAL